MDDIIITEGVSGYWFYHLSHIKTFTRSLCGELVMRTSLPLSEWGKVGHLNERYCKKCAKITGIKGSQTGDVQETCQKIVPVNSTC
jgi:hypothetical protein